MVTPKILTRNLPKAARKLVEAADKLRRQADRQLFWAAQSPRPAAKAYGSK